MKIFLMLAVSVFATINLHADELSDAIRESDHAKVGEILEKQRKSAPELTDKQRAKYLKIAQETMELRREQLLKTDIRAVNIKETTFRASDILMPSTLAFPLAYARLAKADLVESSEERIFSVFIITLVGMFCGTVLFAAEEDERLQNLRDQLQNLYDNSVKNYEVMYDQEESQ
jgi:hypothetical protein